MQKRWLACLVLLAAALTGCGGGGGGGGAAVPTADGSSSGGGTSPGPLTISGTVATGAPVEGAEVSLRDLEGHIDTAITDGMGGYIFPMSDLKRALKPPIVARARFHAGGRDLDLFSISTDDAGGNIKLNITPWSDMVTRAYVAPSVADPDALEGLPNDRSKLEQITAGLKEMAGALLPAKLTDFIKDPFTPDPAVDAHDAFIERTRLKVDGSNVVVADVNDKVLATRSLTSLASGTRDPSESGTVSRSEADGAVSAKGTFPGTTAPVVNEALKVVSSVDVSSAVVGKPVKIVVSGTNLGRWSGMQMTIQDCPNVQDAGGTDTARTFTCTPATTGTKSARLIDAMTYRQLNAFTVTVQSEAAAVPKVVSVSPSTATVNSTTTFTVTGTDLGAGMVFTLPNCANLAEVGGGTSTTRWFSCTPLVAGVTSGSVATSQGTSLKTFSVDVKAAPVAGPVVDSVSPLTGVLNQATTYTVTGTNLIDGMRFRMDGCSGQEVAGGTSTKRQFTCTSGLTGPNPGEVKDKVDGTVLKSFTITITAAPATPPAALTCKDLTASPPYDKYCYSIAANGQKKIQGVYEEYTSAAGTQLKKRETYVDGILEGPATYWNFEFLDTPFKGTYYKAAEGSYAAGQYSGTWKQYWTDSYNAGVDSLGKLSRETTYGLFNGFAVAATEKDYCPYGPGDPYWFPPSKAGQLAAITTTNLTTGQSTTQTFFKTGCQGPN